VDLLGNGKSSKPPPCGAQAQLVNGEATRPAVARGLTGVRLGSASGRLRPTGVDVALAHPLGSCYNFYTWADQVKKKGLGANPGNSGHKKVGMGTCGKEVAGIIADLPQGIA
jgi:hypothetical protein